MFLVHTYNDIVVLVVFEHQLFKNNKWMAQNYVQLHILSWRVRNDYRREQNLYHKSNFI